jgi:DivIVA domain-containing protein
MTTADAPPPGGRRPGPRLTPARVRSTQFPRAAVGRRGYSPEAVDQFVRRVADEIMGRDAAEANLRAQLDRVRRALKQWQSRQLERRDTGVNPTIAPEGRSLDAINTLSQAQQQADSYVAQAQEYCRQITADARNRADAILCEAQERAEATTAQAMRTYEARLAAEQEAAARDAAARQKRQAELAPQAMPAPAPAPAAPAPAGPEIDLAELDRRLAWARTFVAALQSVETQLTSSREALNVELDALDRMRRDSGRTPPPAAAAAPPEQPPANPGPAGGPQLAKLGSTIRPSDA